MLCNCGTNNRAPRWTFTDPYKPELRQGAGIHSKNGGKTASCAWHKFSLGFWCEYMHQPKNITTIPYHFISTLINVNFDFDVTIANDVAIDVAKCSLPD